MKKTVLLISLLLAGILQAQETQHFIDVNGTSEIMAQADFIFFNINIKNVAETLEESRLVNTKVSKDVVAIFNEFKISKEDWEISPIKFGKEYSYSREERKLIGYFSISSVTVKLRNLTDYYSFTSKLSKNTICEITNSDYGVSDIVKYNREAIIGAAKAAKEKAVYIAESLGVKLGKIIQITEANQFQQRPNPFNSVTRESGSTENISGKVSIKRTVNMKLEIVE